MIDGLALGETTPGPLIMVVAFVGFVGGWTKTWSSVPESLALAGDRRRVRRDVCASRSCRAFCFILAGGPLVETTHGQLRGSPHR